MDFTNLKNNFKIRYCHKGAVNTVFSGKPFCLLGGEEDYSGMIFTTLSVGTALAFAPGGDSNSYTVQDSETNTEYFCERKNLTSYSEDNFARDIFNELGNLNRLYDLPGMNMLFKCNCANSDFSDYRNALRLAVSSFDGVHYKELAPPSPSAHHALQIAKSSHICTENSVSFAGTKFILITTPATKRHLSRLCAKMCTASAVCGKSLNPHDFIQNENERVTAFAAAEKLPEACDILCGSGAELFRFFSSYDMISLREILETTDGVLAFRPAPDISAVYAVVKDEYVDSFMQTAEYRYEKKAGIKPTFYICDIGVQQIIH